MLREREPIRTADITVYTGILTLPSSSRTSKSDLCSNCRVLITKFCIGVDIETLLIRGGGGGGGKALTMTMTPWNLPHGQWSKKLTMTMTPSILPMVNGQIDKF